MGKPTYRKSSNHSNMPRNHLKKVVRSHDDNQPTARTPGKHFRKQPKNIIRHVVWPFLGDVLQSKTTIILVALAVYYKCVGWSSTNQELSVDVEHVPDQASVVYSSPIVSYTSLFVPFSVDHDETLQLRSRNIKKWWKHHGVMFDFDEFGIDRRNNLSLQEFWDVYDGKWPVLLTDVVRKWPAYNWTGEFFNETYGKDRVTMKAVDLQLDAAISEVFSVLSELPTEVLPAQQGGLSQAVSLAIPLHMFYKNSDKSSPNMWTYIEDELFIPMRPQLKKDIGDTPYMQEDFFKLFPEEVRPWDAMLLWGTKYSRSSLHMDPYNWTGTNAVIRGRKWWKLYPPGQDDYLYIKSNRKSGFPLNCYKYNSPVDAFDPDLEKYPLFKKASSILFEQLPGEMLFIPSGWYHQAYNGDETLAISSQVMNTNNYRIVLEEVIKAENIYREQLPSDIDHMSPRQQVEIVMSLLPKAVLERGKAVTKDILDQINKVTKNPS